MYTGSSANDACAFNRWARDADEVFKPSRQKKFHKDTLQTIVSGREGTQSKVIGLRTHINELPNTCNAQSSDFSKLDLYKLMDLRECSSPCREKANDELIQRLNKNEITLLKLGIHRFVSDEITKKMKPLLNQIIDFFGESCSKIHHLNLTYSENDFTLLKHFTGLKTLNLSVNNFQDFRILELMPNLTELKMDNCTRINYKDILNFRESSDKCRKLANQLLVELLNHSQITTEDLGINKHVTSAAEIADFFGESYPEINLLKSESEHIEVSVFRGYIDSKELLNS
ncbi:MAG TPA: hypothetical protein VGP47_10475 [Parachlamydiaceae bacterium]|nr:hypothetical protein [Parachlamydiaceae bacterium]